MHLHVLSLAFTPRSSDYRQADSGTASTLETEIDLLEKDVVEATDKERGLLALLAHLSNSGDEGDPQAIAELEGQLEATRVELDRLEAALIHKMAKRSQRAKVG